MNVLWITNTLFPAPSQALGMPAPVVGGWMYALVPLISKADDFNIAVATISTGDSLKHFDIDGIQYFVLPARTKTKYQKSMEPLWHKICIEFKPDIIHIHGTECAHGLACMRACPSHQYIISIQGMVSVIARYYCAGMTPGDILRNVTFRDLVRGDTIFQQRRKFAKRGEIEKEYLCRTSHVMGRTGWDYAHTRAVNPELQYHFCNESLRDEFYSTEKWDAGSKSDFTIFCSQAGYPIKGLHQVLKAVSLLKKDFPAIKLRVAGHSIISHQTFGEKLRLSGYGKYLRGLIRMAGLEDRVHFTGPLSEQQMIDEYKNAHVFICPSSIENSANSVGEAQIIGTPCISAFVGGLPDMVLHGQTGLLYRFEEVEMLAENIRRIFTDDNLAVRLSSNGVAAAENRHDPQINLKRILDIYGIVRATR